MLTDPVQLYTDISEIINKHNENSKTSKKSAKQKSGIYQEVSSDQDLIDSLHECSEKAEKITKDEEKLNLLKKMYTLINKACLAFDKLNRHTLPGKLYTYLEAALPPIKESDHRNITIKLLENPRSFDVAAVSNHYKAKACINSLTVEDLKNTAFTAPAMANTKTTAEKSSKYTFKVI